MNNSAIDIVIPVLNEEVELETNIRKILSFIERPEFLPYKIRIVIADNGSTDSTPEIAKRLTTEFAGKISGVRLEKRGVGLALKTAWGSSQADIVGYMDLDIATDLKHLIEAINAIVLEGFDFVYGSRLHKDSIVINRPIKREITSRVFNFLLKIYLGVKFSDGMCGFKFLKRNVLAELIEGGAKNDNWFFSTELLTIAEWKGLKIKELPIKWTDSPDSKVKIASLTVTYLKAMRELKAIR